VCLHQREFFAALNQILEHVRTVGSSRRVVNQGLRSPPSSRVVPQLDPGRSKVRSLLGTSRLRESGSLSFQGLCAKARSGRLLGCWLGCWLLGSGASIRNNQQRNNLTTFGSWTDNSNRRAKEPLGRRSTSRADGRNQVVLYGGSFILSRLGLERRGAGIANKYDRGAGVAE
jgi:hypothetical protein